MNSPKNCKDSRCQNFKLFGLASTLYVSESQISGWKFHYKNLHVNGHLTDLSCKVLISLFVIPSNLWLLCWLLLLVRLPVEDPPLKVQSGRLCCILWPQIANWVLQRMRPVPATQIITEGSDQHETKKYCSKQLKYRSNDFTCGVKWWNNGDQSKMWEVRR